MEKLVAESRKADIIKYTDLSRRASTVLGGGNYVNESYGFI